MKLLFAISALALALPAAPALAQTTTKTEVKNDTDVKDGVVTQTHKEVHSTKTKTGRPKKVLGVKVGEKTRKTKTVREIKTDSNGKTSTTVEHKH